MTQKMGWVLGYHITQGWGVVIKLKNNILKIWVFLRKKGVTSTSKNITGRKETKKGNGRKVSRVSPSTFFSQKSTFWSPKKMSPLSYFQMPAPKFTWIGTYMTRFDFLDIFLKQQIYQKFCKLFRALFPLCYEWIAKTQFVIVFLAFFF